MSESDAGLSFPDRSLERRGVAHVPAIDQDGVTILQETTGETNHES